MKNGSLSLVTMLTYACLTSAIAIAQDVPRPINASGPSHALLIGSIIMAQFYGAGTRGH